MRYLSGEEEKKARKYIDEAANIALDSTCLRRKCGAVIVKDEKVIGRGYNSPTMRLESQRRCHLNKEEYDKKVTDKTCCVHAEQRAIINALENNPFGIIDSTLYFARLNENEKNIFAGKPYCTICSKLTLDVGIGRFVLWHEGGICEYSTEEYNDISYNYRGE